MGQDYWPIFKLQENALNLPRGWSGLLLPGTRPKHPSRHLAIARLDGDVAEASLRLSFEEGAPVLSASSVVRGQSGTTHLKLEPFESFGETVTSYAEVLGDGAVEVRKMGLGRYLFRTISGSTAEVRMRFADGQAGPFEFHDRDAKILKPNALIGQDRSGGVVFKIEGEVMVLNMDEIKRDQKGPAGELKEPPWIWNGWPGSGYHTFQVEAMDDSPFLNQRKSDARTINITLPQTPPQK